jgi:hypothetical protein
MMLGISKRPIRKGKDEAKSKKYTNCFLLSGRDRKKEEA